jgi:hypothetical protein
VLTHANGVRKFLDPRLARQNVRCGNGGDERSEHGKAQHFQHRAGNEQDEKKNEAAQVTTQNDEKFV